MLPRNHPDRIQIAFDDHRLVANAGLLLPVTLAHHLGLSQLVQERLDLGNGPGRANTGDKVMTLVASASGGDCIDDADALRTGGTARTLGGTVKAPSTLGTFLRSFRWGHVRQLDRSRELLARAWATGAGPGDGPLTIDLAPPSARPTVWPSWGTSSRLYRQAGLSPVLAIAAGTGDVLMCRLREGRANTARGAAHSCVKRWGGCATEGPAGNSRCGPTAASTPISSSRRCALLHHHPPAQKPAERSRPYPRRTGDPILDGRRRRCGRDHLHPLPE